MCDETWGYVNLADASLGLDFEIGPHGAAVLNGDRPECGERVVIAFLPSGHRYGWDDIQRLKEEWQKRARRTLEPIGVLDAAAILDVVQSA
jgi:hypothetical protein